MSTEILKRAVIKEELLELTGDFRLAIVLNQFLYWSQRTKTFDQFIDEENERIKTYNNNSKEIPKTEGWIYKKADQLASECMLVTSKKGVRTTIANSTILSYIDVLITHGWIEKRHNPEFAYDRTIQYRVNLIKIALDLAKLGYVLQDYKFGSDFLTKINNLLVKRNEETSEPSKHPFSKIENADTEIKNANPNFEIQSAEIKNENSKNEIGTSKIEEQYQRLHTEITTKTTIDNTTEEENRIPSHSIPKNTTQNLNDKAQEIWSQLESLIKVEIPEVQFNTWIHPIKPVKFDGNKFYVQAPNEFSKGIFLSKYNHIVLKLLNINYPNVDICVSVTAA